MGETLLLRKNSPEIRKQIEDAGISVCICAGFIDTKWLVYHTGTNATFDVHGVGYGDETITGEQDIELFLRETKHIVECRTVVEFINEIKKFKDEQENRNTNL